MRDDDEFKTALKSALSKLRTGDRFVEELREFLLSKGISMQTTRDVVSYLIERRFVDDRRTISNAVERRSGRRTIGREKLRAELLKRGAPEDLIAEALGAISDEEARDGALALLRAKYGVAAPRDRAALMRAGRYLASRGFEPDDAEHALEVFFGSIDDVVAD